MTKDPMGTEPLPGTSVYCTTHARYFVWVPDRKLWACPQCPIPPEIQTTIPGVISYESAGGSA